MVPKNPLTLLINGSILESEIKYLMETYLPNYDLQYTSGYRDEIKNQEVGGAADSAHMYNLARDFVLINKATGNICTDAEMERIYNGFIKPFWEGWSEFNAKKPDTSTGWIHLNLDREITENTKWIAYAGTAAGLFLGIKQIYKYVKTKMKGR